MNWQISTFRKITSDQRGQAVVEYAVMLAVIAVLVIGTVRLIGSGASSAFSNVNSAISGGQ